VSKTIFVAGATGVLGRPTVQALVKAGYAVRAVARDDGKADWLRQHGVEPVRVDLFDPASVTRAMAGSAAVLRLTTKIPPIAKMRYRHEWDENNRLQGRRSAGMPVNEKGHRQSRTPR
jgi:uncharacterized protein YbjT (DUF2867 family)